ncbi:MAG: hypothetical protein EKK43_12225 [Methylobacterium sp.]|uniref:hypothetical protein n=1 Tax=Methylobacterium sp. TaxID=409 RepID=UPI000F9C029F|nr:hypothetical protein [Methylobacterium sp.]RUP14315.1 MAG: hypothetical protein EKK43_12225 [Methylobacterium sp.]
MRRRVSALLILPAFAFAGSVQPSAGSPDAPATFVEPMDGPHRHCSGSCMKTGALQWICRRDQTCSIDCATAPPKMHCHDPKPPRRAR